VKFRSLRWRIASFYAALLLGVILLVTIVLALELRHILLDEARAKVDRVGTDIAEVVRGNSALGGFNDALPVEEELTASGSLDHWSGPTTYVEVDTPAGYPEGKSTNMGGATFAPTTAGRVIPVQYLTESVVGLGDVLVRDELLAFNGGAVIVQVGENLDIFESTERRIEVLLAVVVVLAAIVVVIASFAVASSAIEPINRLIAAMREIRAERLSSRLGWTNRGDEIGSLAETFDAMLERLEAAFVRERQFISDASHELKTPLTVINANAQMLERWADRDPEIRADSLHAIREESSSLAAMVNGMLLLGKAESGDDIPREAVVLDNVVADAVRSARPRAEEKGLSLNFQQPAPGKSGTIVLGDAHLLRQLFTNLIDNAIKFTERGSIDIEITAAAGEATVSVLDTGVGIDPDALERVFDRFYRTDVSRNRAIPGTGLGLAIVRSIARVHNGRVEAAARSGGGTVFHVTLPTLTQLS